MGIYIELTSLIVITIGLFFEAIIGLVTLMP